MPSFKGPAASRHRVFSAIVLHVRNFGDAHRMVDVLTAEEGRLVVVARHARTSRRRFAGVLDLFAGLELELTTTAKLWQLDAARLLHPRLGLRRELIRLSYAAQCCEAVRLLTAEHQAAPQVHAALACALDNLDIGNLVAAAHFYPQLLAATGITPNFGVCTHCGVPPQRVAGVDANRSGIVCARCAPRRKPLPLGAVAAFTGQPCVDSESAEALVTCALDWIEAQTGRPLRSRRAC